MTDVPIVSRLVRTATLLGLVLLSACGGGGGGDGGGSSNPVVVGSPGTTRIEQTVLVGLSAAPVQLSGSLSGDVEGLGGRTVYVVIEDPAALFEAAAVLSVERLGTGWRWNLALDGRPQAVSGRRTGTLRLRACLDAGCASPLAGTPISLPFDVNVVDGIDVDTTRIEVTTVFGELPAARTVNVSTPSITRAWAARNVTPFSGQPQRVVLAPSGPFSPTGGPLRDGENFLDYNTGTQFQVGFAPAPPGVYTETLSAISETRLADDTLHYRVREITVVYTVTADATRQHWFHPASLAITRRADDTLTRPVDSLLVTATGVTPVLLGVEYLSRPEGATRGPYDNWLNPFPYLEARSCLDVGGLGGLPIYECLVPGVYTARVRWRLDGAGGGVEVQLPVTMTVTP